MTMSGIISLIFEWLSSITQLIFGNPFITIGFVLALAGIIGGFVFRLIKRR